ncbi:class E sortase [Amycolatopsis albispora]|uniref:class E sortase n=1 Tax=Amycolatopsis albispora TaxID=1804986 RepID=UPI001F30D051|nr:class E sortase [Amycolatopsis albispora]
MAVSDDERELVGPESGPVSTAERTDPRWRTAVRTTGEVLITLGIVVLLFVTYELVVTDWFSAEKQADAEARLDDRWAEPQRQLHLDPADGEAFARLYIPAFGPDYRFTIQEGVGPDALEVGPGHYKGTAWPGEPGNFAVAGHRVGKGAPFNDLDLLNSCDAIVVETSTDFFVYRMLPKQEELAGWAEGRGRDPKCAGVPTLRDLPDYEETVGRRIVTPDRGDAVAPVPYRAHSLTPPVGRAPLVTLTTCHPQFSDRERLIIHGALVKQLAKAPGAGYPELLKAIGEA